MTTIAPELIKYIEHLSCNQAELQVRTVGNMRTNNPSQPGREEVKFKTPVPRDAFVARLQLAFNSLVLFSSLTISTGSTFS